MHPLMHLPSHRFGALFAQLGLPSDSAGIVRFLLLHSPLADGLRLSEAPFWTPSQANFLREALQQDSDWSGAVDQLSQALRGKVPADARPPH